MVFGRFFDGGARRRRAAVDRLYGDVVALARDPWLYREGNVPDTFDGRFEMMVWHLALVVRRLKGRGGEAGAFAQDLFDRFLDDMDRSMREAAVGDIAIPKRLQKMVRVWFGLIRAMDELPTGGPEAIEPVLARNLYPRAERAPSLRAVAGKLAMRWREAEAAKPSDLLAGQFALTMSKRESGMSAHLGFSPCRERALDAPQGTARGVRAERYGARGGGAPPRR